MEEQARTTLPHRSSCSIDSSGKLWQTFVMTKTYISKRGVREGGGEGDAAARQLTLRLKTRFNIESTWYCCQCEGR